MLLGGFRPLQTAKSGMNCAVLCCAGPFYLTLAGPSDAFPDLSTPSNKLLIATAVHSALNLGSAYPISNILLWVQQQTVAAAASSYPTPTKRRLSQAATTKIFVLGYSLAKTPELPPKMQLAMIMASAEGTERLADKLADLEFLWQRIWAGCRWACLAGATATKWCNT